MMVSLFFLKKPVSCTIKRSGSEMIVKSWKKFSTHTINIKYPDIFFGRQGMGLVDMC